MRLKELELLKEGLNGEDRIESVSVSASARVSGHKVSVRECSPFAGELIAMKEGHYTRQGIRCKHSCVSDWKDVDWPGRVDEDKFDEFDDSCLALQELNMCIYKPFNAVLCRQCRCLLDLASLGGHLKTRHGDAIPKTTPTMLGKYQFFEAHIKEAFGPIESFSPFQQKTVHRPISFIPQPISFLHCPKCKIPFENNDFITTRGYLMKHFKGNPACRDSDEVKQIKAECAEKYPHFKDIEAKKWFSEATLRYGHVASMPSGRKGVKKWVVYCPEGWSPPLAPAPDSGDNTADSDAQPLEDTCLNIVDQDYAIKLGWDAAFKTEDGDSKIDLWRQLLTSPVDDEEIEEEGHSDNQQALERGLLEVRRFLTTYLESANESVKSYSEIFRRQLTNGR